MAIRSCIYVECDKNTNVLPSSLGFGKTIVPHNARFAYVYCHWDGYPDGVGSELEQHYNTYEKALELIGNGDMSRVVDKIEDESYYSTQDDFHKPYFTNSPFLNMKKNIMTSYFYLFTKEHGWKVYRSVGGKVVYPKSKRLYPYIKGNTIECLGTIQEAIEKLKL